MNNLDFACAEDGTMAYLANPAKLARAALTGEAVEVVVRIPIEHFAKGWRLLRPMLDDGTPFFAVMMEERGYDEDELRILFGLFSAVTSEMPHDTSHYLQWIEDTGVNQYLDDFAVHRCTTEPRCAMMLEAAR